jgi:hypothetical protein
MTRLPAFWDCMAFILLDVDLHIASFPFYILSMPAFRMHSCLFYQCSGSGGPVINWPPGSGSVILNYGSGSVKNIQIFTMLSLIERNFRKKLNILLILIILASRIRIHNSGCWIYGSGFVKKIYESETLLSVPCLPSNWYPALEI